MKIWEHMKQIEGVKGCHWDGTNQKLTIVLGETTRQTFEAVRSRVASELQDESFLLEWLGTVDFIWWEHE